MVDACTTACRNIATQFEYTRNILLQCRPQERRTTIIKSIYHSSKQHGAPFQVLKEHFRGGENE